MAKIEITAVVKVIAEVPDDILNDKTLEAAFAPAQPATQQGVAYAALSESFLEIPDVQDESGINAYYSREAVLECIDAALASHGQAPAGAGDSVPAVDQSVMELAESVGLLGPTSRIGDLHAAIQRFHDLICVNATIKAAAMAADAISGAAAPAQDYPPLPMQFACSGVFPVYSADQMRAYVDADRASHGQAPAWATKPTEQQMLLILKPQP